MPAPGCWASREHLLPAMVLASHGGGVGTRCGPVCCLYWTPPSCPWRGAWRGHTRQPSLAQTKWGKGRRKSRAALRSVVWPCWENPGSASGWRLIIRQRADLSSAAAGGPSCSPRRFHCRSHGAVKGPDRRNYGAHHSRAGEGVLWPEALLCGCPLCYCRRRPGASPSKGSCSVQRSHDAVSVLEEFTRAEEIWKSRPRTAHLVQGHVT